MKLRTRIVVAGVFALASVLSLLMAAALEIPSATVRYPDGREFAVRFPFQVDQPGQMSYMVELPQAVTGGGLSWLPGAQSYRLIPDDQLMSIKVGAMDVSLAEQSPGALRDYRNGFSIDLGPYIAQSLAAGVRPAVSVEVYNAGGIGGLAVVHSWRVAADYIVWFGFGLSLFVAVAGGALSWKRLQRERSIVFSALMVGGLALRLALAGGLTGDYVSFLLPWYNTIHDQGFAAYGTDFANYAPLYLYLLGIGTALPITPLVAIKLISVIGELSLALAAWKLFSDIGQKDSLRLGTAGTAAGTGSSGRGGRGNLLMPVLAFGLTFFLPTALVNGAYWGQCDGLYVSAILWAMVYALRRKALPAMLWWGVAIAFKLQAVFIAPLFVALIWTNWLRWPWIFLAAAPYVLFAVPSVIAGRPIDQVLLIYLNQADTYMKLSMNAPSIHTWFSDSAFSSFNAFGLALAAFSAIAIIWYGGRPMFRRAWDADRVILFALLISIVLPYFMPRMHERYFFAADVLSILWALRRPKDWLIPLATVAASFFSYLPFLFGMEPIAFPGLSIVMGLACALSVRRLILTNRTRPADPKLRLSYIRGRRSL